MPSPRHGGATPIRRGRKRRTGTRARASPQAPAAPAQPVPHNQVSVSVSTWRPGRRLSAGSAESDSSWTDTTDTSMVTTPSASSSPGSRSSSGGWGSECGMMGVNTLIA
ncbi:Microtubule-actin cross-linking factor 1 [Frankliniella fusca]|uniref:Microtubule-actin cross-linking factor 1 n=1 Tax=Frankliniella fusca TaxID=407009 RepID=A0AAE1LB78_9NEOP|nr:Microtubule-actin cross-linking factor 1 [Frankliniella fusca]